MPKLVSRDDSLIDSRDESSIRFHIMLELIDEDASVDSTSGFYHKSNINDDRVDYFSHTSIPPTIP